mmetsp:Transcript_10502/g.32628  ORF Transcript_10502/g.32628 Transcript_10502/m.32628 type:complete len:216 (-) Transcript_10502:12-659(-)
MPHISRCGRAPKSSGTTSSAMGSRRRRSASSEPSRPGPLAAPGPKGMEPSRPAKSATRVASRGAAAVSAPSRPIERWEPSTGVEAMVLVVGGVDSLASANFCPGLARAPPLALSGRHVVSHESKRQGDGVLGSASGSPSNSMQRCFTRTAEDAGVLQARSRFARSSSTGALSPMRSRCCRRISRSSSSGCMAARAPGAAARKGRRWSCHPQRTTA